MWRLNVLMIIVGALLTGCQQNSPTTTTSGSKIAAAICQSQPSQPLDTRNVKPTTIERKDTLISGIVDENKQLGYRFDAKSGQLLKYKTDDGVCVWIYSPESKLLTDGKIPSDGAYVIQVSALKGSTTFNLTASLAVPQAQAPIEDPPKTKPKAAEDRLSTNVSDSESGNPDEFIRQHYAKLNDRNYKYTWTDLSLNFKEKVGSFSDYTQWWDSVETIKLSSVKVISQGSGRAIVDADLQYGMRDGSTIRDDKGRIYLTWNSEEKHWDIESKAAP